MQAPTDNLYKFLAIAGMLCFIYFFFDFNKRSDELEAKVDVLTMQQAEFLATLDGLAEWAEQSTKNIKTDLPESPTMQELKGAQAKLVKSRDDIQSKFRELKVVNAKLNKSIDIVSGTMQKLSDIAFWYNIFMGASLALAALGVHLWYFRTQKYLDLKDKQPVNAVVP